ncbi:hypothetical protein ACF0H5_013768 [Mactra antiquata]
MFCYHQIILYITTYISVILSSMCLITVKAQDYTDDYKGPTYFIPQPNNITFNIGQTATLQCSVENLGDRFVIWRKSSDPHPISIGSLIYAPDTRYDVMISEERREYNLLIHNVQTYDAGVYHCQVSTKEKLIRHILLKVVGRPNDMPSQAHRTKEGQGPDQLPTYIMPKITLSGKYYVNSGETIHLVCNVTGNTDIPQDVDWFRNGNLLKNSDRVHIYKDTSIVNKKLDSVLEIYNSNHEDSGTYVCRNSDVLIESQKVMILSEHKTVPEKRGTAGEAKSGQMCIKQWWTVCLSVIITASVTQLYLR